jgi:hypothetical protein
MIRISRNKCLISIHDFIFDVNMVNVSGSSSAISKSKIMKVTVVMKNHDEYGSRSGLYLGQICIRMGIFFLRLHCFALRLGLLRLLPLLIVG